MFRKHHNLFVDPKVNYPIHNLTLPFSDYITECKTLIANNRLDLHSDHTKIIEANAPFELRPTVLKNSCGVLLIHGLLDSPLDMRDLGKHLQKEGCLVRSILLPGHGTRPGGLLNVTYEEWLQAVRYGINSLKKDVEKIYLVGFSTGAILALHEALQKNAHFAGLLLFSPAIQIYSRFDFVSGWPRVLQSIWPRAEWLSILDEVDYAKYQSITFNSVYQVYRLTKKIKTLNHGKQLSCPLFFALSADDTTVSAKASLAYFEQQKNPDNRLVLYCNTRNSLNDTRIIQRPSSYPLMRIENFSHVSIPISPTNFHYGINGDYIYASHVDEKNHFVYNATNQIQIDFQRLLYKLKLTEIEYQRLTFNPDFEFLTKMINQFLMLD